MGNVISIFSHHDYDGDYLTDEKYEELKDIWLSTQTNNKGK